MFKEFIKCRIKNDLPKLNIKDVYAVSFFLNCNEVYDTIPLFSVSCNVEDDDNKESLSEERWNFAFWLQNEIDIICEEDRESINKLKDWFKEIV